MEFRVNKKKQTHFLAVLFRWYELHRRDMPWRKTRDPYKIMISEIMLQQTQVSRVLPKYQDFIRTFPSVAQLAHASLGDVLRVWSGLGYNRRAKYLHLCSKVLVKTYGGRFPKERELLLQLPGIGPSTASGIRAFAFGEDDPMIDTNVRRVLTRVFFSHKKVTDKQLYQFASTIIPKGQGRDWNYAMLDIAATTCVARGHQDDCPLASLHGKLDVVQKEQPKIPFRMSKRYARGKILRCVSLHGKITMAALMRIPWDSPHPREEILGTLVKEGMVKRRGRTILLP